ncbi:DUF202 domain-containing protein [Actinoallomurus iriomotensis]|uniref:DUF202 domain-containing protein n=1 Tax=Actinoallomurus iriomotensis TaxID=478107 RepID=A0A9W6S704_9ACTN|nr:DUF202 domain-containing protein [Actinoallomurus iriomotensis]GLY88229.1 hypothetical protein Airi02_061580 [Actinoallomurus iriomotensis]
MTGRPEAASDPGLAEERTELAWRRTAIAFASLSGALVKVNPAIGIPALALSALVWPLGRRTRTGARRPVLTTVAVVAVSLMTLTAVLVKG